MKNIKFDWKRTETYPKTNGLKVFGAFVCGGGSTMGFKLAGFNHLGGVEIDRRMVEIYQRNHNPKHIYCEDIRDFNRRNDLPDELFNIDILEGSPPCTTFSMCGNREEDWGKVRKYKEGQKEQTLDDLVFVFCDTVEKLKPKVVLLENVPGIVAGGAKKYAIEVVNRLRSAGYVTQIFSLNSATMGVPQSRERIFFIARRADLGFKSFQLNFSEEPIPFGKIVDKYSKSGVPQKLWPSIIKRLPFVEFGDQNLKFADAKYRGLKTFNAFFSTNVLYDHEVAPTLTSSGSTVYWSEKRGLNELEIKRMSSFPLDFDFCGSDPRYVCGMSVPPVMMAKIASEIKRQWFE